MRLPDTVAPGIAEPAPELEPLFVIRLRRDVKEAADAQAHFGSFAFDPIQELLDVHPGAFKPQRGALGSPDHAYEPRLVVVLILGGILENRNEIRTVVIDIISGLPLRGATVQVACDPEHLDKNVVVFPVAGDDVLVLQVHHLIPANLLAGWSPENRVAHDLLLGDRGQWLCRRCSC